VREDLVDHRPLKDGGDAWSIDAMLKTIAAAPHGSALLLHA
jgi:hypothetical protein